MKHWQYPRICFTHSFVWPKDYFKGINLNYTKQWQYPRISFTHSFVWPKDYFKGINQNPQIKPKP